MSKRMMQEEKGKKKNGAIHFGVFEVDAWQTWVGRSVTALGDIQRDMSRHGASSVSTVIHEAPGHVTSPSAFQALVQIILKKRAGE